MSQDRTGGFALTFERAFADFGVVGGRAGGGDGGEGRECRELELCGDELAARKKELVHGVEEFGVLRGPCCERGQRHVDTLGNLGKRTGFEERGENAVLSYVVGGVVSGVVMRSLYEFHG